MQSCFLGTIRLLGVATLILFVAHERGLAGYMADSGPDQEGPLGLPAALAEHDGAVQLRLSDLVKTRPGPVKVSECPDNARLCAPCVTGIHDVLSLCLPPTPPLYGGEPVLLTSSSVSSVPRSVPNPPPWCHLA